MQQGGMGISLLSESRSQRGSAPDQKQIYFSLAGRGSDFKTSLHYKMPPLGAWSAKAATILVSLSFMHLGFHPKIERGGSAGAGSGFLPCPGLTAGRPGQGPCSAALRTPHLLAVPVSQYSLSAEQPGKANVGLFVCFSSFSVFVVLCIASHTGCSIFSHRQLSWSPEKLGSLGVK